MGLHGLSRIGCCCQAEAAPLLIWMIIDEDEAAYGGYENQGYCGCYEQEDTQILLNLYARWPELENTTVCNRVQANGAWYVHARPPGVSFRDWSRPPTNEQLISSFLSDIGRFDAYAGTIHFYAIIDNSGSMTTNTIASTWNPFLEWLQTFNATDTRFVQASILSGSFPERWILEISKCMEQYIALFD